MKAQRRRRRRMSNLFSPASKADRMNDMSPCVRGVQKQQNRMTCATDVIRKRLTGTVARHDYPFSALSFRVAHLPNLEDGQRVRGGKVVIYIRHRYSHTDQSSTPCTHRSRGSVVFHDLPCHMQPQVHMVPEAHAPKNDADISFSISQSM